MSTPINANFEASLPAGDFADFVLAPKKGYRFSQGLQSNADAAWGEFSQPSTSADVRVSVNIASDTVVSTASFNRDFNMSLYARSTVKASGAQTAYLLNLRLLNGPSSIGANINGWTLYKIIAGTYTALSGSPIKPSSLDATLAYRQTLQCNGSTISVFVRRPTDNFYLKPDGTWQSSSVAAISVTDTSITGSTSDRCGVMVSKSPGYSATAIFDNFVLDTLPGTPTADPAPIPARSSGIAYVSTTGDDTTGVVGNASLPFRTGDVAIACLLPGTTGAKNEVRFSSGRHEPLTPIFNKAADVSPMENIIFRGAGMPRFKSNNRGIDETTGTVIDGTFANQANGFEYHDLGVDRGRDVTDSRFGGTADDVFAPCVAVSQDPTIYPPVTGIVVKNVSAIGCPGQNFHTILVENGHDCTFQNILGGFGFANAVFKVWNSVIRQVTSLGQGFGASYGLISKTNGYSPSHDNVITDVRIGPLTGTGSGALSQGSGTLHFQNVGDGTFAGTFPDLVSVGIDGVSFDNGSGTAVNYDLGGSPPSAITNCTVSNLLLKSGSTAGTAAVSGGGNSIALAAASVTSLAVSVNAGKTLATAVVLPGNAPQYIRWSIDRGTIDSLTGVMDISGVSTGSFTVTGTSYFGANAAPVTGTSTFDNTPDTTAPTLTSGVIDSAGTHLTLLFSESVAGVSLSDYAIPGHTLSTLAGSGNSRTCTISPAVYSTDTPVLNYTGTGTADGAGNPLATISSRSLTNNSTQSAPSATPVATPTFSPVAGAVASGTLITFSSATAGATFYSTIDGSTPTTASTAGATRTVTADQTIKLLAGKAGMTDSAVASAAYTVLSDSETVNVTLTRIAVRDRRDTFYLRGKERLTLEITGTIEGLATGDTYVLSDTVVSLSTSAVTSPFPPDFATFTTALTAVMDGSNLEATWFVGEGDPAGDVRLSLVPGKHKLWLQMVTRSETILQPGPTITVVA